MSDSTLSLLQSADWETIVPKLLDYTNLLVRAHFWNTAQGLPEGKEPMDLVNDAILKTVNAAAEENPKKRKKGNRNWDPETVPDLLYFLKGVIKSDVGHLSVGTENKKNNYNDRVESEKLSESFETQISNSPEPTVSSSTPDAEGNLIKAEEDEFFKEMYDYLEQELIDDEEASLILSAYFILIEEEGKAKNKRIAEELSIDIKLVENGLKRIRRKLRPLYNKMMDGKNE